jgi:hypothetical protein
MSIEETSNTFVKQLTDNFLSTVVSQVHEQAVNAVQQQIENINIVSLFEKEIAANVLPAFTAQVQNKIINEVTERVKTLNLDNIVNKHILANVMPRLETYGRDLATREINAKLASVNTADIIVQQTNNTVKSVLKTAEYPDQSIPGRAINSTGLVLSGDNIQGGIIKKFESTGIQDSATDCQVTILDAATVFENKLVAAGLEIAGDAVFLGNIHVAGEIPEDSAFVKRISGLVANAFNKEYSDGNFDNYCERTINLIKTTGLASAHVKAADGSSLAEGIKLSDHITRSNLQTVGPLKELQVIGETSLDDTVYVSNKRMGVNTLDPERTLDLWDHEVQIIAGKRMQDTAVIGTIRNQNLILTANNKDQLTLNVDGSVTVKTLNIGKTAHSSSNRRPTDNRPIATIVWNESPVIGSPVGWISLGGARWAPFGTIAG